MNYFASCLYGDYNKYQQILDDLQMKNGDKLWLIGDLIDGNDADPYQNVQILNDVMDNPNVEVVLGDHEFAHNMRYLSMGDQESYDAWCTYSRSLDVSGDSFLEYVENEMSKDDQDSYFGSFLMNKDLSAVVPIGDRYFYLVHGAPFVYREEYLSDWNNQVCACAPTLSVNPWLGIKSDPMVAPFTNIKKPISKDNTIVICGQMPPDEAAFSVNRQYDGSGFFYYNGYMCIGRNDPDGTVTVLGIDAAGFFVKGRY